MIIRLFLIAVLLSGSSVFAQMIDETQLEDLATAFHPKYIKDNNIKSVKATSSYKKPLHPIVEKGTYNRYFFNEKGQLIAITETFNIAHRHQDSSITKFYYDKEKLEEKITYTTQGEHAYIYSYDQKGNMERLTYKKGGSLEEKTIVFEEFYTYEFPNDTTKIKWYLNRHGKPYQKEIFIYNRYDYLLSVEKILIFGGKAGKTEYIYNEKGKVSQRIETKKEHQYITEYTYDDAQNLTALDYFKNDKRIRQEEFIYNEKTGMIKAHLSKDITDGIINITKFEVEVLE